MSVLRARSIRARSTLLLTTAIVVELVITCATFMLTGINLLSFSIVLVASLLIAAILSLAVRKMVSDPIADLVSTAGRIARDQDYSIRVADRGSSEVRALIRQFNEMVEKIEAQDRLLRERQQQYRELATKAERESRSKSAFLNNISHEIRTPLNGIIGFAEIILASSSLDDAHEQARIILRESESLLALINDLLDHAKIESGHMELERLPFNLRVLMARIVGAAQLQAQAKGLELDISIDDSVPQYVIGDALRVRQILINLLANAIKFTNQGSVDVRVEQLERSGGVSRLRFEIADTGIGIRKERQQAILESFTQAESSTTRRFGGTGLGTTICRQLVQLMGGEIGLESEPGKGTTFWFWVPFEVGPGPLERPEQPPPPREIEYRPGLILLAEDYPLNQQIVCRHLESAGHRVVCVEDGAAAVAYCSSEPVDLILMDVQMPEMDGLEATRRIRLLSGPSAEVPIIGLTAHADDEARQACREAGMDEVVIKPIRRNTFLSVIHRWLEVPGTAEEEPPSTVQEGRAEKKVTDSDQIPPIDLSRIIRELNGDEALTRTAINAFLKDVERQLLSIQQHLDTASFSEVHQKAHAIRSCAEKLTAFPLAAASELLETFSESRLANDATSALNGVEQRFSDLRQYLASRLSNRAE